MAGKERLRFVLVEPRNPLNIGAAARALANFRFGDLAVVRPYAPSWREARSAVGAGAVLKRARLFDSVAEAVADCDRVVGTSAAQRRRRNAPWIDLPSFAGQKDAGRVAILFGSEKTGLPIRDLALCHAIVRIPTGSSQPSMNLGQAVAVVAYACRAWRGADPPVKGGVDRLTTAAMLALADRVVETGGRRGLFSNWPPAERLRRVQEMLAQWAISRRDAAVIYRALRLLDSD